MNINIDLNSSWLIIFLAMWELVWKGLAMYRAAREDERLWFVAILFINSLGLLPICYLLYKRFKKVSYIGKWGGSVKNENFNSL